MNQVSRRDFLKMVGLTAGAAAAWKLGIASQTAALAELSVSRMLMGTVVSLTVVGEDRSAAEMAVTATLERMRTLESVLSRHQAQSDLSQLNRHGVLYGARGPLLDVLWQAREMSEQTGGAFDVTVKPLLDQYQAAQEKGRLPSQTVLETILPLVNYRNLLIDGSDVTFAHRGMGVTLDGIGKGFIVDEGVAVLRAHGFHNVLVEAGGDLVASGYKASGLPWTLGVQPPRGAGKGPVTRFRVAEQAVATSGDYMQAFTDDLSQHHILDPRRGMSPPELSSVSVVADTACRADAMSTALMVLGLEQGLALAQRLQDVEALVITKEGEVRRTASFPPSI